MSDDEKLARRIDELADQHKALALAATSEEDKEFHRAVKWALRVAAAKHSQQARLYGRQPAPSPVEVTSPARRS